MFKFIRNNFGPFFAGVFFTVFVLLIIAVVYLYSVNASLRQEVADFQRKLSDVEIKVVPPEERVQDSINVTDVQPVFNFDNWNKLRVNIGSDEVKRLLGKPSQIIAWIDSSAYIYRYSNGEGQIYFNRLKRVRGWRRPEF
ncbi:MAG: hypothetical protein A2V66_06260 [Ignavibacteria bacterium RBG_13_36_8]|nr:MAG: hypothetical protein A2V66_06260 [Ignavibacteria bacterium RBG_13_36_8]